MTESGDPRFISDALKSAAYWEDDWKWAQDLLVKFVDHPSDDVRWAVAVGFTFIAAFHGEVELDVVEPQLRKMGGPAAEEALADIDHFVRRRRAGEDIDLGERLPPDWQP